jgi:hypothetical protein
MDPPATPVPIQIFTWSNLNLLSDLEHAPEDGSTGHAPPQLLHLTPGLVHVEAADDDEPRLAGEVPDRNRDLLHDVLAHNLNIKTSTKALIKTRNTPPSLSLC